MTPPASQACGCWGLMRGVWHHQDRRRRGPRELTGIVDHSREGPSHGPLEWTWSRVGLAPCMRTGWPSAANSFAPVSRSRRWIPSRDRKNAIDDQLQDATSVLDAFHIVKLAGDAPGEVRRRVQQDTTGHRGRKGDPLYQIRRHTRPRPTPGRSFHRAPTSLSHPRNRSPGPDPTQVEGRTRRLLRHRRSQQRLHGSHQRTLSSWADAPPEATATPPATNSECSSSQEA